jgi:hypothetical protein
MTPEATGERVAPALDMHDLVVRAQGILARHVRPDGPTAEQTIDELLGLLDEPEVLATQASTRVALGDTK